MSSPAEPSATWEESLTSTIDSLVPDISSNNKSDETMEALQELLLPPTEPQDGTERFPPGTPVPSPFLVSSSFSFLP
jgi:hypothetical protein